MATSSLVRGGRNYRAARNGARRWETGRMRRIVGASFVARASFAAWLILCASVFAAGRADAQPADRFYAGKTLRFIVTYQPGGTYDLYSRLFALHASKHIPGHPPVVVEYMPGAGGMTGTIYLSDHGAVTSRPLGQINRAGPA